MENKKQGLIFLVILVAALLSIYLIYHKISENNPENNPSTQIFAILILLFTLFGIIAISLFLKSVQEKQKKGL